MEIRPYSYITPSIFMALKNCFLQSAFRADPSVKTFQPPSLRLGTTCHILLERVAKGELAHQPGDDWSNSLEIIWQEEIAKQEEALLSSEWEKHFGQAKTWPKYALQKARVFLKAEKLLSYQRKGSTDYPKIHGSYRVERYYQAFNGLLRGRVDAIYESEQGVKLIDYKTGSIFEEDESGNQIIKERYRQQLQLYAAMHYDINGIWPARCQLVPITGRSVSISIDPYQAMQLVEAALDLMTNFNKIVSEEASISELANPSVESCRYCSYKADCPAFWKHPFDVPDWGASAHLEVILLDKQESHPGGHLANIRVIAGTLPKGEYKLHSNRLAELDSGNFMRLINVQIQERTDDRRLIGSDYTIFVTLD